MLIIVYQTNTGHPAVSLYNEFNAQNKFTFKCWSCPAFNVVHQLSCFCALCFAIFADEVVLLIFILQTFSWNHSPIYFVCSSLSSLLLFLSCTGHFPHLKYFEASALRWVTCVVKDILLDIGLNLWHAVVLNRKSVISLLTKNICLLCETIFVGEFYTVTKRGAESALFLFSATHSKFCCSAKIK